MLPRPSKPIKASPALQQLFDEWAAKHRQGQLPPPIPNSCEGVSVDFQTYDLTQPPATPYKANGLTFADDDHVSGPPPTHTRIVLRQGRVAFHCGYLTTITLPSGHHAVDVLYVEGGGTVDATDVTGRTTSQIVPGTDLPSTFTVTMSGEIAQIDIRSANEMYILLVCCR